MNIRYVRRFHMANEYKALMFVGGALPMNISHVGLCPPNCNVCIMFIGSPMNIKATCQSRPTTPALRGP
jgi:hypothetical protein